MGGGGGGGSLCIGVGKVKQGLILCYNVVYRPRIGYNTL